MPTYIIHAIQRVHVRSAHNYWPPETLTSRPTLKIAAPTLAAALNAATTDARKRYSSVNVVVTEVSVIAELVMEIAP